MAVIYPGTDNTHTPNYFNPANGFSTLMAVEPKMVQKTLGWLAPS
jgi:hypothetical protein